MSLTQHLIDTNNAQSAQFFAAVDKVPADKLEWRPLDNGRSALDIAAEVAMSTTWPLAFMPGAPKFEMTEEIMTEFMAEKAKLTSIADIKAKAAEGLAKTNEALAGLSEADLNEPIETFFSPVPLPRVAALSAFADNARYHTGQINYIQTLYGDMSFP
ncbi:MAG: hypothetical protein JSS65_13155 [Armatimonadetes bacterium]|nr:hypothetical protein [Armatimonadota bacterium]